MTNQINKQKSKVMKNRLLKNYITTFLGLIILAFAGYVFAIGKVSMMEAELIAGYGLVLLRSKDSLIGLPAK